MSLYPDNDGPTRAYFASLAADERRAAALEDDTLAAEYADAIETILRDVRCLVRTAQVNGHLDVTPQVGFTPGQRRAAEERHALELVSEALMELFCKDAHDRIVAQQEAA